MTAMKIAKPSADRASADVGASALRISFQTDRPLFPYREPKSGQAADQLKAPDRILRIYFVADARYEGLFPNSQPWGAVTRWSQPLSLDQRTQLLRDLNLPATTGPAKVWLTEFVDHWPYTQAPGDVYFSKSTDQQKLSRNLPTPFDPTLVIALSVAPILPLLRKRSSREISVRLAANLSES